MKRERIEVFIEGAETLPNLVYLPGTQGDWTLTAPLRAALAGNVRFVALAYPRTTCWSLTEYAVGVMEALEKHGIHEAWVLAESFGSQVLWEFLRIAPNRPQPFSIKGVILAGGFARYPVRSAARITRFVIGITPLWLWRRELKIFSRLARFRWRKNAEFAGGIDAFLQARLVPGDREAMQHRLRLIIDNDPRAMAQTATIPLCLLTGLWDIVVPWHLVLPWFRKSCPALRDRHIIGNAGHIVLLSASEKSARQIESWMGVR